MTAVMPGSRAALAPSTVPLTREQLGLLLQHRVDPAASPFHVPVALDLDGPAAVRALHHRVAEQGAAVRELDALAVHALLAGRGVPLEDAVAGDVAPAHDAQPWDPQRTLAPRRSRREQFQLGVGC